MKRHLTIPSLVFLAAALFVTASAPASLAASTPKPKSTAKAVAKSTAKPTAKPTAKKVAPKAITKPTATAEGARRANRFANLTTKQRACLVKQGITIPKPGASFLPRPTASPNATDVRRNFDPTKMAAAYKACGIAVPAGGFAGGNTFNSAKFKAFQKCMTAAGFTSTGGFGRYDQSDPSTVVALVKCQKSTGFTMPKRGQPGSSN